MNISSTQSVSGFSPTPDPFQSAAMKEEVAKFLSASAGSTRPTKGAPGGDEAQNGVHSHSKRLRAYAKKIGARLQNALSSSELTEDQRSALSGLVQKYRDVMKRLESAYLPTKDSGGGTTSSTSTSTSPVAGVQDELKSIVASTNQILQAPPSTSTTRAPAAGTSGGLDTVA
jgi:hypothetical protein